MYWYKKCYPSLMVSLFSGVAIGEAGGASAPSLNIIDGVCRKIGKFSEFFKLNGSDESDYLFNCITKRKYTLILNPFSPTCVPSVIFFT